VRRGAHVIAESGAVSCSGHVQREQGAWPSRRGHWPTARRDTRQSTKATPTDAKLTELSPFRTDSRVASRRDETWRDAVLNIAPIKSVEPCCIGHRPPPGLDHGGLAPSGEACLVAWRYCPELSPLIVVVVVCVEASQNTMPRAARRHTLTLTARSLSLSLSTRLVFHHLAVPRRLCFYLRRLSKFNLFSFIFILFHQPW